jgi:hypothetical protein
MSDFWTDKQIHSAFGKLRKKRGWLCADQHFRNFQRNANVCERRELMSLLVRDHGAFHNLELSTSADYKISFDRKNESTLLGGLYKRFPKELLSHSIAKNLPPIEMIGGLLSEDFKNLLGRKPDKQDLEEWFLLKADWVNICEILGELRLDSSGEFHHPFAINVSKTRKKSLQDLQQKDRTQVLLFTAKRLFLMREAIVAGWDDIQRGTTGLIPKDPDSLCLEMMKINSFCTVVFRCRQSGNPGSPHHNRPLLEAITQGLPFIYRAWDGESLSDADNYFLKKALKASNRLSFNKNVLSDELRDAHEIGQGIGIQRLLTQSENPDVKAKAKAWRSASGDGYEVLKPLLGRRYK